MKTRNESTPAPKGFVWAIGDNGRDLELVPEDEAVSIAFVPLGPGNSVIPATIRFDVERGRGHKPTRLLRVRRKKTPDGVQALTVEFECTRFVRYTLPGSGPVYGDETSCRVFNEDHARDPVFSNLTEAERRRIIRAARRLQA